VLALQGIGWLTRKAIGLATVYLHVKQYTDDAGVVHIDIDQTATGGLKGTSELRTLDWVERPHSDHIFGQLNGKTRWIKVEDVDDDFLNQGFLEDDAENGGPAGERHVESLVVSDKGWTARQIWGFATVEGERYYIRRVVVTKGDQSVKIRIVYNWQKK
jgi:hypothetical protein